MNEVVDIKTKKRVLFTDSFHKKLDSKLAGFTPQSEAAAEAVEQVFCTAIVEAAKNFATKLAEKLFDKLTSTKDQPKP